MSYKSISDKVNHVRGATQTRGHTCHWPGCKKQVPPALWGCKTHWYMLPQYLRNKIWKHYQIGQEETLQVSQGYLDVAIEVQEWIEKNR